MSTNMSTNETAIDTDKKVAVSFTTDAGVMDQKQQVRHVHHHHNDFSSPLSMPSVVASSSNGSATTIESSPDESVSMETPETKFDLGPTRRTLFHKLHPWDRNRSRSAKLKTPQELREAQSFQSSTSTSLSSAATGAGDNNMITPPPTKKYDASSKRFMPGDDGKDDDLHGYSRHSCEDISVATAHTAKSTPSPIQLNHDEHQHKYQQEYLHQAISTRRSATEDEMPLMKSMSSRSIDMASITSSETTAVPSWNLSQSEDTLAAGGSHNDDDDNATSRRDYMYQYVLASSSGSQNDDNRHYYHNVEVPLDHSFLVLPPSSLFSKHVHPLRDTWRQHVIMNDDGADVVFEEAMITSSSSLPDGDTEAAIDDRTEQSHATRPAATGQTNQVSSPTSSSSGSSSASVESTNSILRKDYNKENEPDKANYADPKHHPVAPTRLNMILEDPPEEASSNNMCASVNQQLADIILAFGPSSVVTPRSTKPPHPPTLHDPTELPNPTTLTYESPPPIVQSTPFSENSGASIGSTNSILATRDTEKDQYQVDDFDRRRYKNEEWMINRVESLYRECAALKRIIQEDASRILNLQRAVEAQKQLNALKEVEIVDKQTELKISEERISRLKKDREHYVERETELVETIKILKSELDRMTLQSSSSSTPSSQQDGFSEMQKSKAAIAVADVHRSQIAEQRSLIQELQMIIQDKEESNIGLQAEIDWLKSRQALWEPANNENTDEPTCKRRDEGDIDTIPDEGQEVTEDGEPIAESIEEIPQVQQNIVGILEVVTDDADASEQEVSQVSIVRLLEDLSQRLAALERDRFDRESAMMAQLHSSRTDMEEMQRLVLGPTNPKSSEDSTGREDRNETGTSQRPDNLTETADNGQSFTWCCDFSMLKGTD